MFAAWKEVFRLPRDNWILFATTLMNRTGTMVLPFLMLYLTKHLGYSLVKASTAFTVFGLVAAVSVPFTGKLCDSWGTSPVLKLALLGCTMVLCAIPRVHSYPLVMALVGALACFSEAIRPASMAYIGEINEAEDHRLAAALNRFAINLGMSIGPFMGGFIVAYSYPALFYVNAVTSLLALVVFTHGDKKRTRVPATLIPSQHSSNLWGTLGVERRIFMLFVVAMFPLGMIFVQGESLLPLYMTGTLHLSEKFYGLIFSINTVLILVFEIWLNVRMKLWKDIDQLNVGCLLIGLGMGLSFFTPQFWVLVFPTMLWTFGEMILYPAATSVALGFSTQQNRGLVMGLFTMTFSCSYAFGPTLGALVHRLFNFTGVSLYCFFACGVSMILMNLTFYLRAKKV